MRKLLLGTAAVALFSGCMSIESRVDRQRFGENPYTEPPFYARYLDGRNQLDRRIQERIDLLATDPNSPALHNELGALLIQKGFPNDAAREFKRALYIDDEFYPAWYNLGLLYHARGNSPDAARAFKETVDLKPGHASAHFMLGLIYEERGSVDAAVERYVKAITINPNLLEVSVNPRILDSKLVGLALLKAYDTGHRTKSILAQGAPRDYVPPPSTEAPSPQERPQDIVSPAPPPTEQGIQPARPAPSPTPNQ
jgi:tetratricopeptide (TPR) repeat protein